jgi:hypothetical protein
MARNNKKSGSVSNKGPLAMIAVMLSGFLLILLAAWMLSSANDQSPSNYIPEARGGPSLKVDQDEIDFGEVQLGKTVTATVQLTNVGDQTLKFTKKPYIEVKEGC